jgi:hypothetical protein
LFANDRVGFPITDTTGFVDYLWPFVDRNAPLELTTTIWRAVTFFTLFLTEQVSVENTVSSIVTQNVLRTPLGADVETFFLLQPTDALLWVPIFADQLHDTSPGPTRNAMSHFSLATVDRETVSLLGTVALRPQLRAISRPIVDL